MEQRCRVNIESVQIYVKFACRFYLEFQTNGQLRRTKEIRVDAKTQKYAYGEEVSWSSNSEDLKLQIKLLSNNGLAFTAGLFKLETGQMQAVGQTFRVDISKSQDVDASCLCRVVETFKLSFLPQSPPSNERKWRKASGEPPSHPDHRSLMLELPNPIQTAKRPELTHEISPRTSDWESKLKSRKGYQESEKPRERHLQERIHQLQLQLQKSNSLFEKQKEIMQMMESKQTDMKEEQKDMRVHIRQNQQQLQQIRRNCRSLEDEKMSLMVKNLTHQKEIAQLREQIQSIISKTYDHLLRSLQRTLHLDESIRREKRDSQHSEPQGKGLFINRFSLSQKPKNEDFSLDMNEPLRENVSLDLSCSFHQISLQRGDRPKKVSLLDGDMFLKGEDDNARQISALYERCLDATKINCGKIQKIVGQYIEKIEKQMKILSEANRVFRAKLHDNREKFENNEESLIGYMQQLQQGLQKQLASSEQKDRTIWHLQNVIEDLNQHLVEKQIRLSELQERCQSLNEQKAEIREELHQNNYAHATKQEQFMKRIYLLENGFDMPHHDEATHPHNIVRRRDILKTELDHSGEDELHELCERIRDKQLQLGMERKERARMTEMLQQKESELQQAQSHIRKLQFAISLKKRMSDFDNSLVKSYKSEDDQQAISSPVKSLGMQEEFLKVLT